MLSSHSPRRVVAVALCAGLLMAGPAGATTVAASSAGAPVAAVATSAPQAHASVRSKKYCAALYKKLRKSNSPKVAKFLAQLRGCIFKVPKKKH